MAAPMRVLITGAAGQIGYALAPMVARGALLGPDQPVILHLLDIPFAAEALEGVRMELVDAAFPLVQGADRRAPPVPGLCQRLSPSRARCCWPLEAGFARRTRRRRSAALILLSCCLAGIVATTDVEVACHGVNIASALRRSVGLLTACLTQPHNSKLWWAASRGRKGWSARRRVAASRVAVLRGR